MLSGTTDRDPVEDIVIELDLSDILPMDATHETIVDVPEEAIRPNDRVTKEWKIVPPPEAYRED